MKRIFTLILCGLFLVSFFTISASAAEHEDILISRTVEFFDDGDFVVREVYENYIQSRSNKTGYSTTTYYNAAGTAIWDVVAEGTFTYNGVTSSATGCTAIVRLYSDKATFISKSASTSGNSATATGTVRYNLSQTTRNATVSCDRNGNLY